MVGVVVVGYSRCSGGSFETDFEPYSGIIFSCNMCVNLFQTCVIVYHGPKGILFVSRINHILKLIMINTVYSIKHKTYITQISSI